MKASMSKELWITDYDIVDEESRVGVMICDEENRITVELGICFASEEGAYREYIEIRGRDAEEKIERLKQLARCCIEACKELRRMGNAG